MLPYFALGISEGLVEYHAIRTAYRALPRLSYVATHPRGEIPAIEFEGKAIRGAGYRLEIRMKNPDRLYRTILWKASPNKYFVWREDKPEEDHPEAHRGDVYNGSAQMFGSSWHAHDNTFASPAKLPLVFAEFEEGDKDIETGEHGLIHFERISDIQIDGRPFRQIAAYYGANHSVPARSVFAYDPKTKLLREFRREVKKGQIFVSSERIVFRYRDAKGLTKHDFSHAGKTSALPKLSLRPISNPEPAPPIPNDATTLAAVEEALMARYRNMATYRDSVNSLTTPFQISMAMDRGSGSCVVVRRSFETVASVRGKEEALSWQIRAKDGYQSTRVTRDGQLALWHMDAGSNMIARAWDGLAPLDLEKGRWALRNDMWREKSMRVLSRSVCKNDPSHVPKPPIPAGTVEVWIDVASGLIVRSRWIGTPDQVRDGLPIYDAVHEPETNPRLKASDLTFHPPVVDAIRMLEEERKANGARPFPSSFGFSFGGEW